MATNSGRGRSVGTTLMIAGITVVLIVGFTGVHGTGLTAGIVVAFVLAIAGIVFWAAKLIGR